MSASHPSAFSSLSQHDAAQWQQVTPPLSLLPSILPRFLLPPFPSICRRRNCNTLQRLALLPIEFFNTLVEMGWGSLLRAKAFAFPSYSFMPVFYFVAMSNCIVTFSPAFLLFISLVTRHSFEDWLCVVALERTQVDLQPQCMPCLICIIARV